MRQPACPETFFEHGVGSVKIPFCGAAGTVTGSGHGGACVL